MQTWALHYMNARGTLDSYKERVDQAFRSVARLVEPITSPIALDIVVQAIPGGAIPDIGHVGYCSRPGLILLILDPDNPNLANHMGESLERMIAHELHHAMRWDSVGHGKTLGEALVMEGLAGRFVLELYGGCGEPWELELPRSSLKRFAAAALPQLHSTQYDHGKWFFGDKPYPRWVGYSLGWHLVGDYLQARPGARASASVATPAVAFYPCLEALAKQAAFSRR